MTQPNIIFILIDDMGWKDLTCTGSDFYETPNIDRLCSEGMRFTNGYASCPVCSPSRASVMTGKYPARISITNFIDGSGRNHPNRGRLVDATYLHHLPTREHTVAKALADGGYATWHLGKWHLGKEGYWPQDHGFQVNVGGCASGSPGAGGYFSPWSIPALLDADVPEGTYLTDYLTDNAVKLIRSRDTDTPFFMNLCYYTVHTPIQAKAEKIAKYEAKAEAMGRDTEPFEQGEAFPGEHGKKGHIRRRVLQSNPVYAAMIESLDEGVGRILGELDAQGIAEDTLVIFTSDNGGLSTAEGSPTCNLPLAEGKGWMYEGGTREPLLARWPGTIVGGTTCDTPVTSTDYYPTFLAVAGLPPIPKQHCDGESILPLLQGTGSLQRDAIFWHFPHYGNQGGTPGASVRCGDFKLISFFEFPDKPELYNLKDDPGESHNLAPDMREQTEALLKRLHAWQLEVGARIPKENPYFEPWEDRAGNNAPFKKPQPKSLELEPRRVPLDDTWDVIVLGGGPAGCAAAGAASREGARTLLVEATYALGGMGTSGLVPAWCPFTDKDKIIYGGLAELVLRKTMARMPHLNQNRYDWQPINPEVLKQIYDDLMIWLGVDVLFGSFLTGVETDGEGNVDHILVANKKGLSAYRAKLYIDCTGDADLAAWAGAAFEQGDEAGDLQPATHCFSLGNVDDYAYRHKGTVKYGEGQAIIDRILASGKFPLIPDGHACNSMIAPGTIGFNAGHLWDVDNTDPMSVSRAAMKGRAMAHEFCKALTEFFPEAFGNAFVNSTGSLVGIRETRRVIGDYVLTLADYSARASFPDEICRNSYPIDIHTTQQEAEEGTEIEAMQRFENYGKGESHGIPYRCLTPKGLNNVLVAGRSISTDRTVQGSTRVMPVCLAMGEAAGLAAALAAAQAGTTREIDVQFLRRRLVQEGAYLPGVEI